MDSPIESGNDEETFMVKGRYSINMPHPTDAVIYHYLYCLAFVLFNYIVIQKGDKKMTEFIQVFVTIDDESKAEEIAEKIVEKRLAACVQIAGPLTSIYRWEDKVNKDREWLLIIKSSEKLFDELEKELIGLHTYDTPEILAFPVVKGSMDYLNWLNMELK